MSKDAWKNAYTFKICYTMINLYYTYLNCVAAILILHQRFYGHTEHQCLYFAYMQMYLFKQRVSSSLQRRISSILRELGIFMWHVQGVFIYWGHQASLIQKQCDVINVVL